jgi:hypothetical protein
MLSKRPMRWDEPPQLLTVQGFDLQKLDEVSLQTAQNTQLLLPHSCNL